MALVQASPSLRISARSTARFSAKDLSLRLGVNWISFCSIVADVEFCLSGYWLWGNQATRQQPKPKDADRGAWIISRDYYPNFKSFVCKLWRKGSILCFASDYKIA
jgi:hypothetical protein